MFSGSSEGPSDWRDEEVAHAISTAYTTNSIRFCCKMLKKTRRRRNELPLHPLPLSISEPFAGPAPAFWIGGGRLPLADARSKFQPYYAQTLYPVVRRSKLSEQFQIGSRTDSSYYSDSLETGGAMPAKQWRCYKPTPHLFSRKGHPYIMNDLCRRSSGVEQRFRKP